MGVSLKLAAGLVLLTISFALSAHAALGAYRGDLDEEGSHLKLTKAAETSRGANYTKTTLTTASTVITEYTNTAEQVFAITWRGNTPPDLSIILGKHYSEYQSARKNIDFSHGRKPLLIKTSKLVIRHFGHMRDLRGLAYQPEFVPAGVNPEALQ